MNRTLLSAAIVVLVLAGITLAAGVYTVDETEYVLVLQFGEPRGAVTEPGMHFKTPFIQEVLYFDNRVLDYDAESRTYVTSDKKNLIVDSFSKWRIEDPLQYYVTVTNERGAKSRLGDMIRSGLRDQIGKRDLQQVVSGERREVMETLRAEVSERAEGLGIHVLDVRIKRTDLPKENEQAVYQRMSSEREREAREYRAEGAEQAEEIMATAERERAEILAEARREAEVIKGEAEAKATQIYANAYGLDEEFFSLYRSFQAYDKAFHASEGNMMVLSPDSEFFHYFNQSEGMAQKAASKQE